MSSYVSSLLSKSVNTMVGPDEMTFGMPHGVNYTTTAKVDRKGLSAGIQLVGLAVEEFEIGNDAVGLDIYLSGLDKIIMSLPNLRDLKTKQILQEKFLSIQERLGITQYTGFTKLKSKEDRFSPTTSLFSSLTNTDTSSPDSTTASTGDSFVKFQQLGSTLTDVIVHCVVLFKQSPLPGLLYFLLSYFVNLVFWIDQQFHVVDKVQLCSIGCIKLLLAVDERYHLHEYASETVCTLIRLYLKAVVAYKETPSSNHTSSI
ncbi:hypothetical protein INT47_006221 [Mucor saturninus]|uniref:Uncharacterized protein n=1 Tax=Mucor saturninus TaxID=64648 RepID=A0A8H7V5F2_9FUNG|nr:hypothetical protein INT47_006221 [Mucor saturninus]